MFHNACTEYILLILFLLDPCLHIFLVLLAASLRNVVADQHLVENGSIFCGNVEDPRLESQKLIVSSAVS